MRKYEAYTIFLSIVSWLYEVRRTECYVLGGVFKEKHENIFKISGVTSTLSGVTSTLSGVTSTLSSEREFQNQFSSVQRCITKNALAFIA